MANILGRWRTWAKENTPYFVIFLLLVAFSIAYMFHRIVITVEAGEAGVLFRRFSGTDINTVYGEGIYLVWPWNILNRYSVRIQETQVDIEVLSQDGLAINITMSIRFRPTKRLLGTLHQNYGPDYINTYIVPELESSVRRLIGIVTPAELYSSARDSIESAVNEHLHDELREFDEFTKTTWPEPKEPKELAIKYREADPNERVELDRQLIIANLRNNPLLQQRAKVTGLDSLWFDLLSKRDSLKLVLIESEHHYKIAVNHYDELDSLVLVRRDDPNLDSLEHRHEGDLIFENLLHSRKLAKAHLDSSREELLTESKNFDSYRRDLDELERTYDRLFMLIDLSDVLIKRIKLPPKIEAAIQTKLQQEQIAEEFDFRLIRERKEAERKRIEAEGIRDFQNTISTNIKPGLLRWKAIEATLQLAKSNNSKVVVIGAGEQGLPIILGNESYTNSSDTRVDTTLPSQSVTDDLQAVTSAEMDLIE